MVIKEFEMFYFDDKTFVGLCKQLEKELKSFVSYTSDNAHDLRLAYQKFELFLTVYHHSRKRENIDYKKELRMEIATEINQMSEDTDEAAINDDYRSEHFTNAKENLERVMEDLIYQITMRNLAPASDSRLEED